jgi:hypothetical protein
VHVLSLGWHRFRLNVLSGDELRHASLAVWHINLEGLVASHRIERHLIFDLAVVGEAVTRLERDRVRIVL